VSLTVTGTVISVPGEAVTTGSETLNGVGAGVGVNVAVGVFVAVKVAVEVAVAVGV